MRFTTTLRRLVRAGLCPAAAVAGLALSPGLAPASAADVPGASGPGFSALPLYFEALEGPGNGAARFIARTRDSVVSVTAGETSIVVRKPASRDPARGRDISFPERGSEVRELRVALVGANTGAALAGLGLLAGKANYFLGNDPAGWRTGVALYDRVGARGIYPGVDLVYYGNDRQLEYDFSVSPGADPRQIAFRITGAEKLRVDELGDLVLSTGVGEVRQHRPVIYQLVAGVRKPIAGAFRLKDPNTVEFEIGAYDQTRPLVIDPVLSYSSYFGGAGNDHAWDLTLDGQGNIYIVGDTLSYGLATPGAARTYFSGATSAAGGDAFVAKFDNSGSNLIYFTYLGGSGNDSAAAVAVDAQGNAYVTGVTDSLNFPLRNAVRPFLAGQPSFYLGLYPQDAFVAELNPTGSQLVYSTYYGGDGGDQGLAIAVDAQGSAYVTGYTKSTNLFTINALSRTLKGGIDAFVLRLSPKGQTILFASFLGGSSYDDGQGIAVDAAGRIYLTGWTRSWDFPVTNALQSAYAGGKDAFLTILDGTTYKVLQSTFLGGAGDDLGSRVALDASGNVYVAGIKSAYGFPITPGPLNPGGFYASGDAAGSWQFRSAGLLNSGISELAVDRANPSTLYAATFQGVFRSTNAGGAWQSILPQLKNVSVAVNPTNPAELFAGGYYVFRSTNSGVTWSNRSSGLPVGSVSKLVIHPSSPSTIYAATTRGLYRSTNSGALWKGASTGIGANSVLDLVFDPHDPGTLYAATAVGFFRSTNSAASWTAYNRGLTAGISSANWNSISTALAVDPLARTNIYLGTSGGLFKSTNLATNWVELTLFSYTNVTVTKVSGTNLYTTNVFTISPYIISLAIDPAAPSTLYAGTSLGLFKSTDAGLRWAFATNGLTFSKIGTLVFSPTTSSTLYAGTTFDEDFGATDAFVTKFGSPSYSVAFGGSAGEEVYGVAADPAGNAYVVGSTTSTNFPVADVPAGLASTNRGAADAFVTAIAPDGSALDYSVLLGGKGADAAMGVDVDAAGNAYLVGITSSTDFPIVDARRPRAAGGWDVFMAKLVRPLVLHASLTAEGNVLVRWQGFLPEYTLESRPLLDLPGSWTPVAVAPVFFNGWNSVVVPAADTGMIFRLRGPAVP